ncbi:DUF5711 family protein [Butyrivibrio sp. WCD2001]|uniref:DUF5711 family protein n=1 Tax=Butyrivibrio sp. WCD2001 TaxID=1280681 RepID=UPI000412FA15|nr:DUF5711 family protein [Butyrivibrio sp. WCD2001]
MAEVKDFTKYIKKLQRRNGKGKDEDDNPFAALNDDYDWDSDDDALDSDDNDYESVGPSYQEKIRNHRIAVFIRTVVIIAIAALLVGALYVSWRDKHFTEANIISSVKLTDASGAKALNLGGNILTYSKDGMSCLDGEGQQLWNQTYQMQNPTVHTCKNVVAVGDYNGHNIYVANTSGTLGEIDTNLPIRDFCVASQGVVAAVLDDKTVTWIYLFDASGNTLASFKTTMQDSGYPTDISISPSGELVCVSYLKADSGKIKTSVAFFNFGEVGQNLSGNYASGYEYPDVVVPYVQFMNNSKIFAVADDRIMFFAGKEIPTSQTESLTGDEEIRSVFYSESHVGIVFMNNTDQGAYRLQIYGETGALETTIYFDTEYVDVLFENDQIVVYGENEYILYDMKGTEKFRAGFDRAVKVMIPTTVRSKFLLVTEKAIETLELK